MNILPNAQGEGGGMISLLGEIQQNNHLVGSEWPKKSIFMLFGQNSSSFSKTLGKYDKAFLEDYSPMWES